MINFFDREFVGENGSIIEIRVPFYSQIDIEDDDVIVYEAEGDESMGNDEAAMDSGADLGEMPMPDISSPDDINTGMTDTDSTMNTDTTGAPGEEEVDDDPSLFAREKLVVLDSCDETKEELDRKTEQARDMIANIQTSCKNETIKDLYNNLQYFIQQSTKINIQLHNFYSAIINGQYSSRIEMLSSFKLIKQSIRELYQKYENAIREYDMER